MLKRMLTVCAALLGLAVPLSEAFAAAANPKAQMRPCRNDTFFMDVPLQSSALPWATANAAERIRRELQIRARQADTEWFGRDIPTLRVTKKAVFPSRADFAPRADGHLRFWRFNIDDGTVPLTALDEALCDVVANLRLSAAMVLGANATQVRVGRECDATAEQQFCNANGVCVDPPAWPSEDALTWHLDSMGIDPATVVYGTPRTPPVNIALLDAPIEPVVRTGLGVTESRFLPLPATLHRHGTDMALLLRQVSRDAKIFSVPVLDGQGVGQLGNVAKGLDRALFLGSVPGDEPLVVNMSLGFPPEMVFPAYITGNVNFFDPDPAARCVTTEDGAGESLRYALDVARHLDGDPYRTRSMAAGTPAGPIVVVSATGNRDGRSPGYRADLLAPADHSSYDNCANGDPNPCPGCTLNLPRGMGHMFYPGNWSWRQSGRVSSQCQPNDAFPLTMAAAATDDQDVFSPTTPVEAMSILAAPGVNVYVNGAAGWNVPAPAVPNCAAPVTDSRYTLPHAVTGSSAASALVTAMTAEAFRMHRDAQARRTMAGLPPLPSLNRASVAELLYLTGDPTPNVLFSVPNVVRRISRARLQAALECETADSILLSLTAVPAPMTLSIDTAAVSRAIPSLEGCGLPFNPVVPNLQPVSWPQGHIPPNCEAALDEGLGVTDCQDLGLCLPYDAAALERYGAGALGPQPTVPVCPECGVTLRSSAGAVTGMDLAARINATLPSTTQIKNPRIVVRRKFSPITEQSANLSTVTSSMLVPGYAFSVVGISTSGLATPGLSPSAFASQYNVLFRVDMRTSATAAWVSDSSTLRITY